MFVTKFCAETTLEMRTGTNRVVYWIRWVVREFCKAAWYEVNRFAWDDVEQWFDVENNDDVRDASISDIADDMEQLAIRNPRSRY